MNIRKAPVDGSPPCGSSGGIPDRNDLTGVSRIGDAATFGVTTTIRY
ncbi:hypothetical protein IVA88_24005 [Bradyrhizobium sp. 149]|nr:hypothetical protein [Bradyrhizobium sp. 149]MCK1654486.1 hypothetical protein [Bradyrhizobium sp. 149]